MPLSSKSGLCQVVTEIEIQYQEMTQRKQCVTALEFFLSVSVCVCVGGGDQAWERVGQMELYIHFQDKPGNEGCCGCHEIKCTTDLVLIN